MVSAVAFQWLGQVGDYCEQLYEQDPEVFAETLNESEQFELLDVTRRANQGDVQAQQRQGELQGLCHDALQRAGTPSGGGGGSTSIKVLQRQINGILAPHGCHITEDGILGEATCGGARMINSRSWGTVTIPNGCAAYGATELSDCKEVAKKGGAGVGIFLLAAAALLGIGFALTGRG